VRRLAFILCALIFALGCSPRPRGGLDGVVELVLLHTSDLHSALFPYGERVGWADAQRGLGAQGALESVGGVARLATLVGRERARARRSLLLDSGDAFQGSLAFDTFSGEPELLALAALGVQAQALGNHELDRGGANLDARYGELATFPLLAANYAGDAVSGLTELTLPYVVLDASGLRVGVVGVGNVRSVPALRTRPNELGVVVRDAAGAVQGAVDMLRPAVDLVVVLTHLGLDADRALVRATSGVDVVLGGHQHIALDDPRWEADCGGGGEGTVRDAWGIERRCVSRRVPIVHSGAYAKYLGRLALDLDDDPARLGASYDPLDAHEVVAATFELLPVQAAVAEAPAVVALLEPYRPRELERLGLADVLGFAPATVARVGATGADSPLGNFAAGAARWLANADVALIGASSLRRDLAAGALDADALERSFPFDDPLLRVRLSGRELSAAFERAAATAASRDCQTPIHISGALVRFSCPCGAPPCAAAFAGVTELCCRADADCGSIGGACDAVAGAVGRCFTPVVADGTYWVATTAYLADGNGRLLEPVDPSAREPVADGMRESITEALRESAHCAEAAPNVAEACTSELVARAEATLCSGACTLPNPARERARALCRALPCLDERAGARRDGRIRLGAP
jgi:5'-nucleotidase/UDP-sugar diphosphatase